MTEFEARPPTVAVLPTAVAAAASVLAVVLGSTVGLALTGPGAASAVYGAHTGNRRLVTLGGALAFVGAVVAGATGLPLSLALFAGIGALVAYDTGEHAVSLGVDVGADANVTQSVLVHTASTLVVGSVAGGVGYALYAVGPGNLPVTGLVALLVAAVFLAYALGD
ncbi:DUF7519 family protein [Halobacterium zhouii]|uniref:DUF7519 family protein n=1 Tax=Halobacterium zhouii TaxID=2902624 RepID=UPI001E2D2A6C|nr:hypothetical protein [Halobacterium zhouii]